MFVKYLKILFNIKIKLYKDTNNLNKNLKKKNILINKFYSNLKALFFSSFFNNNLILYIRRSRSFNKSRYSRNRQQARVIFYIGLIINILVIFFVLYAFFKFSIKLSYNWYFFSIFIFFSIFSFFFKNNRIKNIFFFFKILNKLIVNVKNLIKLLFLFK